MNKMLTLLLVCVAGVCLAGTAYQRPLTLATNGTGSVTFTDVRGTLEAIHVIGVTTGTVTVAYTPAGGLTAVNLATNSVAMQKVFRPVATSTDVAGAGIADYSKYELAGEDVTFSVSGGADSAEWKCVLILK